MKSTKSPLRLILVCCGTMAACNQGGKDSGGGNNPTLRNIALVDMANFKNTSDAGTLKIQSQKAKDVISGIQSRLDDLSGSPRKFASQNELKSRRNPTNGEQPTLDEAKCSANIVAGTLREIPLSDGRTTKIYDCKYQDDRDAWIECAVIENKGPGNSNRGDRDQFIHGTCTYVKTPSESTPEETDSAGETSPLPPSFPDRDPVDEDEVIFPPSDKPDHNDNSSAVNFGIFDPGTSFNNCRDAAQAIKMFYEMANKQLTTGIDMLDQLQDSNSPSDSNSRKMPGLEKTDTRPDEAVAFKIDQNMMGMAISGRMGGGADENRLLLRSEMNLAMDPEGMMPDMENSSPISGTFGNSALPPTSRKERMNQSEQKSPKITSKLNEEIFSDLQRQIIDMRVSGKMELSSADVKQEISGEMTMSISGGENPSIVQTLSVTLPENHGVKGNLSVTFPEKNLLEIKGEIETDGEKMPYSLLMRNENRTCKVEVKSIDSSKIKTPSLLDDVKNLKTKK